MASSSVSLTSSNLANATFTTQDEDDDASSGTLIIEFRSGKSYAWQNVPREVYEGLLLAPSPGKFFYSSIQGQYGKGIEV